MENYQQQWRSIAEAKDIHQALFDHFLYLADTPGFETVLKAVMDEAFEVGYTADYLIIKFPGNEILYATRPLNEVPDAYPRSYRNILARHEHLHWEKAMLSLGEHGVDLFESIEDSKLMQITSYEKLISPLWDYSDCWLYHPIEQNQFGEPVIYYLSHEGGEISRPQPYNAGALFLKRSASALDLNIKIPLPPVPTYVRTWWESLDENWRQFLANELGITTDEEAQKIVEIKELYISDNSSITTIKPVTIMKRLVNFYCDAPGITDISCLKDLPGLKSIRFSGKQITDFSPLAKLVAVRDLALSQTAIQNLDFLSGLVHLEHLNINDTQVEDITALSNCVNLQELNMSRTRITDSSPLVTLEKLKRLDVVGTPLTSFVFLSGLTELEWFYADNTVLQSLQPLFHCKRLSILSCRETNVSFKEVLSISDHFNKSGFLKDNALVIYSDYGQSTEIFIESIEEIDFTLEGLEDIFTIWVNSHLISILKHASNKSLINRLLSAYLSHAIALRQEKSREELAANSLVGISLGYIHSEIAEKIFQQLIPDEITLPRLAFNLACYYASKNNKPLLLKYTFSALEKGYDPTRFRKEADFKNFQQDPDFLQLLNSLTIINPQDNPIEWWRSLPDNLKETLGYYLNEASDIGIRELLRRKDLELYYQDARDLEPLIHLKGLRKLILKQCKAGTLAALASIESIEELECEANTYLEDVRYNDISFLAGLKNLNHVKLNGHLIRNITPLKALINLKTLELWGSPLESIDALQKLINLENLVISLSPNMQLDTMIFNELEKLEYLDISSAENIPVQVISLSGMQKLQQLRMLFLGNLKPVDGSALSLAPLSFLGKLERLSVRNTTVDNLESLYQLKNLHSLYIQNISEAWKIKIKENMPWCKVTA